MEDSRLAQLSKDGIRYVRMIVVDTSNILRIRIIPIKKFLKFVDSTEVRGVFMSTAVIGSVAHADYFADGLPPVISCHGEICAVPDVTTSDGGLRRLLYGSGTHALCMVNLEEKDYPGVPFVGCARSILRNLLKSANDELGLSFLVGFEVEVIFLEKPLDSITPIDNSTYGGSIALHSIRTAMMIDEIVEAITAEGIEIAQFHGESAPGQFEFVTDPYDPLTAVDNLVRTRETIYNIAAKYDVKATLAPKVFTDYAGSGSHCHISIKNSSNVKGSISGPLAPKGLTALEENFLEGILKHLSSLCPFLLPNVTSYNRTKDNCWAGSYISWGIDNREATLRLAYTPGVDRKFRLEVKSLDGTANPYLAVSAIFIAGLDGIHQNLQLTSKELIGAPAELGTQDRLQLKKLPTSIEEALSNLAEPTEYEMYCKGMGKAMVDIFIAVKKGEAEYMRKLSAEEQLKFVIKTY